MVRSFAGALAVLALLLAAPLAAGQESKSVWGRTLDAVDSTTPFPVGTKEEQDQGWFSGSWDGVKQLWRDGTHDVYLSGYTWHLPYAYSTAERREENANTWGAGFGKTMTDERDNQRSLYAMVIEDSNFKVQYSAGYAWMARWRVVSDVRVGLGYTAALISRADYWHHVPFPAVLPLASIGNNTFGVFATFIPGSANILYFFGRVTFDAK